MHDVRVQAEDFSMQAEWELLRSRLDGDAGAVAAFVGLVRDLHGDGPTTLTLEHYPGMTEKGMAAIVEEAGRRWSLAAATVIHRVGCARRSRSCWCLPHPGTERRHWRPAPSSSTA